MTREKHWHVATGLTGYGPDGSDGFDTADSLVDLVHLAAGELAKVSETRAQDLFERDPDLWAVVVSPWVMVQERGEK